MTAKDVSCFERVRTQLATLHSEFSVLSKGKPDNPVNKFKLSFINEKLRDANTVLTGEFKPFSEFLEFEDAALPTNSDVVMVLSQYLDGLEAWRSANIEFLPGLGWHWKVADAQIKTTSPSRFRQP
jgi:hypothetical protein